MPFVKDILKLDFPAFVAYALTLFAPELVRLTLKAFGLAVFPLSDQKPIVKLVLCKGDRLVLQFLFANVHQDWLFVTVKSLFLSSNISVSFI